MDLSKALDCIQHDLFAVKLDAYGYGHKALYLVYCILGNKNQSAKIDELLVPTNYSLVLHKDRFLVSCYPAST